MTDNLYERYPVLSVCRADIETAIKLMCATHQNGGKILLCGNGGSASDSDHIAGELLKGFLKLRPMDEETKRAFEREFPEDAEKFTSKLQRGIPAISLHSQTAALMAFANDVEPSLIYAQAVFALAKKGDLLIGLSTSGNSKNVINAFKTAKAMGLSTIALTGEKPCLADGICDIVIKAPASETYKIQELHLPIYHELCARTEEYFFKS